MSFRALFTSIRLLSTGVGAVLSQPRCQLRLLLRLKVYTIVDTLDRLFVGALSSGYLVSVEEIGYLVAQSGIAETACGSDHFVAGKRTTHFLQFRPMLANEIPRQSLPCRIRQDVGDKLKSVL